MRQKVSAGGVPAKKKGTLFVISGPSGSGKTTLVKAVLAERKFKHFLSRSISFTTRSKRSGERNGKDYFFITKAQFLQKLEAGEIFEWTKYLDNYYGTPRSFVEEKLSQGKSMFFCLDIKGARAIKKRYPEVTKTIFVSPSRVEALSQRIRKRCVHTKAAEIAKRLRRARQEMKQSGQYDYQIVNNELADAVEQLKKILELQRRQK